MRGDRVQLGRRGPGFGVAVGGDAPYRLDRKCHRESRAARRSFRASASEGLSCWTEGRRTTLRARSSRVARADAVTARETSVALPDCAAAPLRRLRSSPRPRSRSSGSLSYNTRPQQPLRCEPARSVRTKLICADKVRDECYAQLRTVLAMRSRSRRSLSLARTKSSC